LKINVKEIKVGKRFRKDMGDLTALMASIEELGLLQPIGVNADHKLLFGERRLRAVEKLGWETVECKVIKNLDEAILALKAERDENTCRKDFWPTEAVEIGARLEDLERPKAKERQGGPGRERSGKLPEQSKKQTRDIVAPAVGMKPRTYEKAKEVVEVERTGYIPPEVKREYKKAVAAEEKKPKTQQKPVPTPKPTIPASKFAGVSEMMDKDSVDKAHKEIKRRVQDVEAEKIRKQPPPKQQEGVKYDIIVVDPPWRYDKRADDVTHRARNPYPTMSIEEIEEWGIDLPTKKDCILWLWTTNAFMREAFDILDAWGFEAKTILTWVKNKMGTGDWLRGKTEHCILAVKGKPKVIPGNATTVLEANMGKHSEKPEEFFKLVEKICVGNARAEYFSRTERKGWHVYGNEVKKGKE